MNSSNRWICKGLVSEIISIQNKVKKQLGVPISFAKASEIYQLGHKTGGKIIVTKNRRGVSIKVE